MAFEVDTEDKPVMRKITLNDVKNLDEYERAREDFREKVIALKKKRRIQLGPRVSLLFENRQTVLFQIQEMLRTERITRRERVAEEIDVYNTLIPADDELSATLFIEFEDSQQLVQELPRFVGIENAVTLIIGEEAVAGVPDEIRSKDDTTSTIHYLKFRLTPQQRQAFISGADASLAISHPNYSHSTKLGEEARSALAQDLA